jgi:hypothetical protein
MHEAHARTHTHGGPPVSRKQGGRSIACFAGPLALWPHDFSLVCIQTYCTHDSWSAGARARRRGHTIGGRVVVSKIQISDQRPDPYETEEHLHTPLGPGPPELCVWMWCAVPGPGAREPAGPIRRRLATRQRRWIEPPHRATGSPPSRCRRTGSWCGHAGAKLVPVPPWVGADKLARASRSEPPMHGANVSGA